MAKRKHAKPKPKPSNSSPFKHLSTASTHDTEIFAMYDSKVESYGDLQFAINEYDITRQIVNMFKDPQQAQNRFLLNAEDYSCFKIGNYTKKTGKIEIYDSPIHVSNMHDLRAIAQRA